MSAATSSFRRPVLNFGLKLTLAMVFMMTGVSVAAVLVVRQQVDRAYRGFLSERFEEQVNLFFKQRDTRLAATLGALQTNASNVRLIAALGDDAYPNRTAHLYDDITPLLKPLRDHLEEQGTGEEHATFYRWFDVAGQDLTPLTPKPETGDFVPRPALVEALTPFVNTAGTIAKGDATSAAVGFAMLGSSSVYEITVMPKVDTVDGRLYGFLVFGQLLNFERDFGSGTEALRNGLLLNNRLISKTLPPTLAQPLAKLLTSGHAVEGMNFKDPEGAEYLLFFRQLQKSEGLPPAWQVSLYSLGQLQTLTREIAFVVVGVTLLTLLCGFLLAAFISRRMTQPILNLVGATEAVGRGDYSARVGVSSRDEIGRLSASFNEMAVGLELKEKYRNVLDRVSDREVAKRLLQGQLSLGGELREVSVLFCDIRGFTQLTERMDPARVVEILNEHMTALTKVVQLHRGVVDKFVGDSLMVLFGAPKSYGQDARDAANCALALVAERERLSDETGSGIRVGVGVATGRMLAGCMGSVDRLNYTVLGDRVNLAARLCARAQAGEVLIDGATRAALDEEAAVEELETLPIKGFTQPIQIFRLRYAQLPVLR